MWKLFLLITCLSLALRVVICIKSSSFIDGRIVGGIPVNIEKHPHQVSVRYRNCLTCSYNHLCGGSIYSEYVVITAAHCVLGRNSSNFMIVAGTENRKGCDGIIVPVETVVVHENYNKTVYDNDFAIVFLSLPLPINNVTIAAISLADKSPDNGTKSTVTGWGITVENGPISYKLLEVDVLIVSNQLCNEAYGDGRITNSMLCAGVNGGGKDACQGDSGGPLIVNKSLTGIVSWGKGCARPDFPGVYANVAYGKSWIINKVKMWNT